MTPLGARYMTREFWTRHDPYRPATHPAVRALARQVVVATEERTRLAPGSLVLDVGSGNGAFALAWAKRHRTVALDLSRRLLLANPARWRVEGDVFRLPFVDRSFDLVFCGALLHHVPDVTAALREMRRVSRMHVAAMEPNRNNPAMALFGLLVPEERGLLPFTAAWLAAKARSVGLSVRLCAPFGWIAPNKLPALLVPVVERLPPWHPLSLHIVLVAAVEGPG